MRRRGAGYERATHVPEFVALDSNGNIYIADYYAHKIRMVSGSTGIISTLAGTGVRGYAGDGGPANKAKLGRAYGVAVDSFANVYITDTDNNRVRCVIQTSGGCGGSQDAIGDIVPFAFNGRPKFGGDGGSALKASMRKPLEVAVDSGNNVFISGGTDDLVRRIDATGLTIETVAGDPQHPRRGGFRGDGGPATKASLNNAGVAIDHNGNLLIADSGNDRVREVTLSAVATLSNKTLTFPATTFDSRCAAGKYTHKHRFERSPAFGRTDCWLQCSGFHYLEQQLQCTATCAGSELCDPDCFHAVEGGKTHGEAALQRQPRTTDPLFGRNRSVESYQCRERSVSNRARRSATRGLANAGETCAKSFAAPRLRRKPQPGTKPMYRASWWRIGLALPRSMWVGFSWIFASTPLLFARLRGAAPWSLFY